MANTVLIGIHTLIQSPRPLLKLISPVRASFSVHSTTSKSLPGPKVKKRTVLEFVRRVIIIILVLISPNS
jgi:hypothetical protein